VRYQYKSSLSPRKRRHLRVRAKLSGTPERPRLNVFRSSAHMYAQVIDDTTGRTLVSASSVEPDLRSEAQDKTKTERATVVGTLVAERAKAAGIEKVVFDRGGFKFHGRVKALAEAARKSGLEF
jgi:large subunit ribosomal protein L18